MLSLDGDRDHDYRNIHYKLHEITFALSYGVDPSISEHKEHLMPVILDSLYKLPDGYDLYLSKGDYENIPFFYNHKDHQSSWNHPLNDHIHKMLDQKIVEFHLSYLNDEDLHKYLELESNHHHKDMRNVSNLSMKMKQNLVNISSSISLKHPKNEFKRQQSLEFNPVGKFTRIDTFKLGDFKNLFDTSEVNPLTPIDLSGNSFITQTTADLSFNTKYSDESRVTISAQEVADIVSSRGSDQDYHGFSPKSSKSSRTSVSSLSLNSINLTSRESTNSRYDNQNSKIGSLQINKHMYCSPENTQQYLQFLSRPVKTQFLSSINSKSLFKHNSLSAVSSPISPIKSIHVSIPSASSVLATKSSPVLIDSKKDRLNPSKIQGSPDPNKPSSLSPHVTTSNHSSVKLSPIRFDVSSADANHEVIKSPAVTLEVNYSHNNEVPFLNPVKSDNNLLSNELLTSHHGGHRASKLSSVSIKNIQLSAYKHWKTLIACDNLYHAQIIKRKLISKIRIMQKSLNLKDGNSNGSKPDRRNKKNSKKNKKEEKLGEDLLTSGSDKISPSLKLDICQFIYSGCDINDIIRIRLEKSYFNPITNNNDDVVFKCTFVVETSFSFVLKVFDYLDNVMEYL